MQMTFEAKELVNDYERLLKYHPKIIREDIDHYIDMSKDLDEYFEKELLERKEFILKLKFKKEKKETLRQKTKRELSKVLVKFLILEIDDIKKAKEKNEKLHERFKQIKAFM